MFKYNGYRGKKLSICKHCGNQVCYCNHSNASNNRKRLNHSYSNYKEFKVCDKCNHYPCYCSKSKSTQNTMPKSTIANYDIINNPINIPNNTTIDNNTKPNYKSICIYDKPSNTTYNQIVSNTTLDETTLTVSNSNTTNLESEDLNSKSEKLKNKKSSKKDCYAHIKSYPLINISEYDEIALLSHDELKDYLKKQIIKSSIVSEVVSIANQFEQLKK